MGNGIFMDDLDRRQLEAPFLSSLISSQHRA
jgi:hypothetical protein